MIRRVVQILEVPKCRCDRCRKSGQQPLQLALTNAPEPAEPPLLPLNDGAIVEATEEVTELPDFNVLVNKMKALMEQTKA